MKELLWNKAIYWFNEPLLLDIITGKIIPYCGNHKRKNNEKITLLYEENNNELNILKKYTEKYNNERVCKFEDKNKNTNGFIIITTWNCKAHCAYCYAAKEKNNISKLKKEHIDNIIKNIDPDKITDIIYIGGEPLENLDIIKYCIEKFNNAFHTICTSFIVDDEIVDDLIKFIIHRKNVEIALSIDPQDSLRYKVDTKINNKINDHNRISDLLKKYCYLLPKRIRARVTINTKSYDIHSLRNQLPKSTIMSVGGAGYGFGKIEKINEEYLRKIKDQYEKELINIENGDIDQYDSILYFVKYNEELFNLTLDNVKQDCSCGIGYKTILPTGELSVCDSPGVPTEKDLNFKSYVRENKIKASGKCSNCKYLRFCGGSCEVNNDHELYCYVRLLDYLYSLYVILENKK